MQLTTSDVCAPDRAVPVLHIHGTDDPCWVHDGGPADCPIGGKGARFVSVERTMDEWAAINGCSDEVTTEALPDRQDDGTTTERQSWTDCQATTEHLRIDGGGHLWPDGYQYLGEGIVGVTPWDWGNEVVWAFFEAHPMPQPTTAE